MKSALKMNNKAIVSSKGQVVIPRLLREKMKIHTGNELLFRIRSDNVIEIRPMSRSIKMFFGRCKRANETPMTIEEMDKAIMQAVLENDQKTQGKSEKK